MKVVSLKSESEGFAECNCRYLDSPAILVTRTRMPVLEIHLLIFVTHHEMGK